MSMHTSYIGFNNIFIRWICIFFLWITCCNCDKVWDVPPLYTGPALKANISIKDLLRLHIPNNFEPSYTSCSKVNVNPTKPSKFTNSFYLTSRNIRCLIKSVIVLVHESCNFSWWAGYPPY